MSQDQMLCKIAEQEAKIEELEKVITMFQKLLEAKGDLLEIAENQLEEIRKTYCKNCIDVKKLE